MKTTTVSVYAAFFFILVLSVSCRRDSEAPDVAFQKIEMCMESLPDTALYLLKSVPHPEKIAWKVAGGLCAFINAGNGSELCEVYF